MNRIKTGLAAVLLVSLLIGLTACGAHAEDPKPVETDVPAVATEPSETAAPAAETPAPAADNETILPDGEYVPEKFSFSGGSGKVTITCPRVRVEDGRAWATVVFSSKNYTTLRVGEQTWNTTVEDSTSFAEIPARLNQPFAVYGTTTAMSQAHEIEYNLYIFIPGAGGGDAYGPQSVPGLEFVSADETSGAKFAVYRYSDGYVLIDVAGTERVLLVPAEREMPPLIDANIRAVHLPVKCVYLADRALYEALSDTLPEDLTVLTGFEAEGLTFAGESGDVSFAQLLRSGCGLAILPAEFADSRVTGCGENHLDGLSDDDAAVLAGILDGFDGLGIPAFIDCSALEETEKAAAQWMTVYDLLLGGE